MIWIISIILAYLKMYGYTAFCDGVCRSHDFNDFVSKCLVKDPAQRSAAADLLRVSHSVNRSIVYYIGRQTRSVDIHILHVFHAAAY